MAVPLPLGRRSPVLAVCARIGMQMGIVAHAISLGILLLLWSLLFFRHAGELGLYGGDWYHLALASPIRFGTLLRTWPLDFRPMEILPWLPFATLFGHAVIWYYVTLFATGIAIALLLYVLSFRFSGSVLVALAVAALWSVYPADSAAFWLTSIHYWLGLLFLLLGVALLVLPSVLRPYHYLGVLLCCALVLISLELYLGLLLALPLAVALRGERRTSARLSPALPFLLLVGFFALYRLWIGPKVLHLPDAKAGYFHASPFHALKLEAEGMLVVLAQAWRATVTDVHPAHLFTSYQPTPFDARALITPLSVTPRGVLTVAIAACEAAIAALALALAFSSLRLRYPALWERVRIGVYAMGIGLLIIFGGYLALSLTLEAPSLNGVSSRVNTAAIPGATLFIIGAVWMLAHLAPLPRVAARSLFAGGIALFSVLGAVHAERTAAMYHEGWVTQRQLWQALLRAVPALRPHTLVVITARDHAGAEVVGALLPWGTNYFLNLAYPGQAVLGVSVAPWDEAGACTRAWYSQALGVAQGGVTVPYGPDSTNVLVLQYSGTGTGRMAPVGGTLRLANGACALHSHPDLITARAPEVSSAWSTIAGQIVQH